MKLCPHCKRDPKFGDHGVGHCVSSVTGASLCCACRSRPATFTWQGRNFCVADAPRQAQPLEPPKRAA
jgi:hypothetical protein